MRRRRRSTSVPFVVAAALAVGGLVPMASAASAATDPCVAPVNVIACENSKPGNPSTEWDIEGAGDDTIQGFSTDISVNVGSTISFKVKTNATNYKIDIYRTGYYNGDGARKIATVNPSVALPQTQPACLTDATLIYDCGNWAVSASWAVPSTAVSGVYIAKLTRNDTGGASHIPFIVRNDASTSKLVFQTSDTTWQAYNLYGGANFYPTGVNGRAYKVSYNRPFDTRGTSPYGQDYYFSMEYPLVRFLESNGYDVSYISGVDVARNGALIKNHKAFLSVGHDEYWSGEQRTAVESARDAGVHLAFMSGNEVYWKTRWEKSLDASQTDWRTIVCYKETWANAKIDPSAQWTGTWRDPRFSPPSDGGKPENALTGTAYMVNDDDFALKVPADDGKLRFWRNTTVATQSPGQVATLAPSTIGYESDEDLDNGFRPAGLMRLSTTTGAVDTYLQDYGTVTAPGTTTHHLTLYRAASGALVFGAGTVQFTWGLDAEHDAPAFPTAPADVRMQQAVVNLFADMGVQPTTLQAGLVAATQSSDTTPPTSAVTSPASGASLQNGTQVTVTGTASDVGGVVGGVEVSLDNGATWHPATGRGSWTYTGTVGGIGASTIKVRAVDDSGNLQTPTSLPVTVTCPCTLFSTSATPATVSNADTNGIELGMKFTSDTDGWISGVRFYKGPTNTGTHVGSLWTAGGVRLGQVTFTGETASGWQTASFASPIEISAGATYVVSYYAPSGGYSSDGNYFSVARDNAPLHALKDGAQGPNGVYKYGTTASNFPTSSFQAANYWVDAVFTTNGPPDTTPPSVQATLPVNGQATVDPAAPLKVAFSETMQAASITWNVTSSGGPVTGTSTYENIGKTSTFTPSAALATNRTYTVTLDALDRAGNALPTKTWQFTTWTAPPAPGDCPCTILADATPAATSVNDPAEIEVGVKFRAATDGYVNGVSFYKGAGNSGPHTVTLWDGAGTVLATTQAYFETAGGWQDVYFSAPVPVAANTTYVASYHTVVGFYSATSGLFANAVTNGPLTALANGTEGGNGVYAYGPTAFPTNSFGATSYGVDVIFTVPPDTAPPTVLVAQPGEGATSVPVGVAPKVTFSEAVAAGSVTLTLTGPGGAVAGTTSLDAARKVATFTPSAPLTAATQYTLAVSGARDAVGNVMTPYDDIWTTSGAAACPCSIFASDALPGTPSTNDSTPVEVGAKFTASANGFVTGVRFYKGTGNTGVHEGRLWDANGSLLTSVTFQNESATGWQTVSFAAPVAVTAGTTYVVSYWAPQGHYSSDPGFFAGGPYVNEPLTALAANGVFSTVQGNFPTNSFGATNYWVDVVFTTTPPPDTTPPTVLTSAPAAGATSVPPSSSITVTYNETIQSGGVTMTVTPAGGSALAGTTTVNTATNTVTFAPAALLASQTVYTVSVSGAKDTAGNTQASPSTFTFTTAAPTTTTCPCTIWPDATVPTVAASSDTGDVEVGVKFRSDVNGFVTGVRFYKGVGNGGTHTGRLWSSTGTLLATATFANESTTGWQTVSFAPAVAVTANTTYVASYHAPVGRYAADVNYFAANGVDNGVLHALRSGVDGVNGVYAYGPASFPTQGTTTNYWVDVVFSQTADVTPPTVTTWTPASGATGVASGNQTVNLAQGGTPTASSTFTNTDWNVTKLNDGVTASSTGNLGWSSNNSLTVNHTEWARVDLGAATQVGKVVLWPRSDGVNAGYGFPVDFSIRTSTDGTTWSTATTNTGYARPAATGQTFSFAGRSARYVEVNATSLRANPNDGNQFRLQLAELQVFAPGIPTFSAVLSEPVQAATVTMSLKETVAGTAVAGTTTFSGVTNTVVFTPSAALKGGTQYTLSVTATDANGNAMPAPATATFTTVDQTPPVISAVTATGVSATSATVAWTTDENSSSVVQYGTTTALGSTATGASGVTAHSVTLTGLTANARIYYRVVSADAAGNSSSSPASPAAPASYVPAVAPLVATTVADLSAGTNSATYVANTAGGEVTLNPTLANEFDGTALGTNWTSTNVVTGGVTTVSGGQVVTDATYIRTTPTYGNTSVVEMSGTLGTIANRFFGFGVNNAASGTRIGFTTGAGNQLQAVTRGGFLDLQTSSSTLTASLATGTHTYRVERTSTTSRFLIDGLVVATHNLSSSTSLAAGLRDDATGNSGPSAAWIRVLPYTATTGTWTSPVIDASAPVAWGAISSVSTLNGGTVTVQTRTGNTAVPDGTWTAFTTRANNASVATTSRYIQYRITLTSPNNTSTPSVDSVTLAYAVV